MNLPDSRGRGAFGEVGLAPLHSEEIGFPPELQELSPFMQQALVRWFWLGMVSNLPMSKRRKEMVINRINFDNRFDPEKVKYDFKLRLAYAGVALSTGWLGAIIGGVLGDIIQAGKIRLK